ncbi:LuxR family transcriptional regulator [Marinobacterium nitratireducens]|uniref:LuxR family transcriptional regulator n=1 Tax=Marinobacterium nitratireducens TaxID=518897 RepID=A0A918DY15_9GAMM|nr:LuxR C-terminal-related transcriptional regulator [Marinobacterium nitratireducens]GGO89451.1 LuxR family transcriptional regulator [Marinobacterium nitratireducens]
MAADYQGFSVLETKLAPPLRWGYDLLERERLLGQLQLNRDKRLVLISASAGYGKSTLMAQWSQRQQDSGERVAWLTLDEDDNDPVRLYTYLFQMLRGELPGDLELHRVTRDHAAQLAGLLAAPGSPSLLCIDELEVLVNAECLQLLYWFSLQLPPGTQLIVASRETPDWELGRLRLSNELFELHDQDLRLNLDEAKSLTTLQAANRLSDTQTQQLVEKTEGWMAGIRLALLCMAGWDDNQTWIEHLSGEVEEIADFLAEQVFRHLGAEQQLFLLSVAVLNRMSAPLCEALTGQLGAQVQLQSFCKRGLFIQPIDPQRRWFRMHRLVRQFLLNRLERQLPNQVSSLHEAAARWFAEHDSKIEAIHHAVAAANPQLAGDLLASISNVLVQKGQLRTLTGLAARIPEACLLKSPRLVADLCWVHLLMHQRDRAAHYLRILHQADRSEVGDPGALSLPAMEPLLLVIDDRAPAAAELGETNLGQLRPEAYFERGVLSNIIAYGCIGAGQLEKAQQFALQAHAAHLEAGSLFGVAYAALIAAMRERAQGNLAAARQRAGLVGYGPDYGQPVNDSSVSETAKGVVNGLEVDLLYELNALDEAEQLLNRYFPVGADNAAPDMVILGYLTLARIAFAKGRWQMAESRLEEGEVAGLRWPLPRLVEAMRWQRVQFALQRGDLEQARALSDKLQSQTLVPAPAGYMHPVDEWVAPDLVGLRVEACAGEAQTVLDRLPPLLQAAERRPLRRLRLLLLEGLCIHQLGRQKELRRALGEALDIGRRTGALRSFLDEGGWLIEALKTLVRDLEKQPDPDARHRRDYSRILLDAAGEKAADKPAESESLVEPLSDRELEALALVGEGLRNEQIAEKLFLSINTIKWHLRRAYEKLGVRSRTEALAEARRRGLIE